MTRQEEANRSLAAKLLQYYSSNDHKNLLTMLTDDCVFKIGDGKSVGTVPYHGTFTGPKEIGGYLATRQQNTVRSRCEIARPGNKPPPQFDPQELLVSGDTVVALGSLTDTFKDGRPMHDTDFALVFHIDEKQQKVRLFRYFLDTAAAVAAWKP